MTAAVDPASLAGALPIGGRGAWQRHGVILAATMLIISVMFRRDITDITTIWWSSTTFGHCLLIPPIIGWLVWQRRAGLAAVMPAAWLPGLAIVAAGGTGWLIGDAAGVAIARHLGLVVMLQGTVVTLLGQRVARALMFPLAYGIFMVPFGEGLEAPLQGVTVAMIMPMLAAAGVPATVDGVLITIPNGYFEVAEACSGAKFVIAMFAYGILVANVCFVSWRRRIGFMAVALAVPVLANGLRAFSTIYAAHLTSVAQAAGFDHIVYGWLFFGVVMAAVLAIGWRWFDRDPDAAWFDPSQLGPEARGGVDVLPGATMVIAIATCFSAASVAVAGRSDPLPRRIELPAVPGWHRIAIDQRAGWTPYYPGADHYLIGRYGNDRGDAVDLAIAVFASQREGREMVAFGVGVLREDDRWVRIGSLPDIASGAAIRITAPGPVERIVATWYRVGSITTNSEKRVKIETLRARLTGGKQRAVAVHASSIVRPGGDARGAIVRFVAALGPIDRLADERSEIPR